MRNFVYLLSLLTVCTYSAALHAHDDRGSLVEGVRWHGHQHSARGNSVLHDAFGNRGIWGITSSEIGRYNDHRDSLTSNGYDKVLVAYVARDHHRRRRDDGRRHSRRIAVGIAHQFTKHRLHEVAIENLDGSRSVVVEVRDIRGVLMTHSNAYGNVLFDERALPHLGSEWQQRFPTDNGQRYRFYGKVAAAFTNMHRIIAVHAVRHGSDRRRGHVERLREPLVALLHTDFLDPHTDRDRDRDRRRRDVDRPRDTTDALLD